jgi:arylsulfatase A-like enzyme
VPGKFGHTERNLPVLLIVVGAMAIAMSFAVDFIRMGSKTGFGPMQIRLAVIGVAILVAGLFLLMPAGQQYIREWRAPSTRPAQPVRPVSLLVVTVWFAMLTGLSEVSILADKKFLLREFIFLSPHVVWMAPVVNLFIFAVPALILFLVVWRSSRPVSLRNVAFIFAFLGFLSLLLMITWFHRYAALVLAVGLALQTARLVGAHSDGFYSLVRRTTGWMVTLVVGLTVGVFGWQELAERRAVARLVPASPPTSNILLIILDTVRAQSLSLHGYARPTTPQLDRLAENGVMFERALSTSPWTLPSHASMFTGRFPNELFTEFQQPLDSTYPTLAEVFSRRGFLTAGFSANLGYGSYETGLNRGFIHYEDYPITLGQTLMSSSLYRTITNSNNLVRVVGATPNRKSAEEINGDFLSWLSHKDERPFFAFLNYFDAHMPYRPPESFDPKFGPRETQLDAYESCIAYLDGQIGLLVDELNNRGLLENTLVIITSDHGEQFGEHNLFGHGNSVYLSVLHVPLLIIFPSRVPAGKKVREMVTLRDIPATVVDLVKLNDAHFPGTSLARYWNAAKKTSDAGHSLLLSEERNMKSLVVDRYHYIVNRHGREELYDIESDPAEQHNFADTEEGRRVCERLRTTLEPALATTRPNLNLTRQR